jgi:hypothetical protein
MKSPYLARMVLKDLVRLRDKVEKAIDKRVGRERVSLEGKIAQLSFLARPGTIVMGKKSRTAASASAAKLLSSTAARSPASVGPAGD